MTNPTLAQRMLFLHVLRAGQTARADQRRQVTGTASPVTVATGHGFEFIGVLALAIGAVVAIFQYVRALRRHEPGAVAYSLLREQMGRAILIGLEFLVAADIIRTVAIAPTLQSVLVLGLIILVRTFLSWALEVEIEGRWPWQSRQREA
jgi:uncharacterized membrane protein